MYALALLDFNCNDTRQSSRLFRPLLPYALGSVGNATIYPAFVRGRTYLAAHKYFGVNPLIESPRLTDAPGWSSQSFACRMSSPSPSEVR